MDMTDKVALIRLDLNRLREATQEHTQTLTDEQKYALSVVDDYMSPQELAAAKREGKIVYYASWDTPERYQGACVAGKAESLLESFGHENGLSRLIDDLASSLRDKHQLESEIMDCWFGSKDYKYDPA